MRLTCYPTVEPAFVIRPASIYRVWMDSFPDHFAYRCLPVNIANMHAWEILCPFGFEAQWNGGPGKTDIEIRSEADQPQFALSHFGGGILTLQVGYVFRTPPEYNLWVTGPINVPKDAIVPLTAVIEADWAPYSFTMNWMFTRGQIRVRFQKGEPFCAFFPLTRGLVETVHPEIRDLAVEPEFQKMHAGWCASRKEFLDRVGTPESRECDAKWQKDYFKGIKPDGTKGVEDHRTKLSLRPVIDSRAMGGIDAEE